jgi:hypothetical protein
MSSAAGDGNVRRANVNSRAGQIVAESSQARRKHVYDVIRLSFDDCDDLSFSDDVVELDQDSLDSSCRRRRDRNFHLHGFDESNLVAVADIATGCDRKRAHATGDFGNDLDVWHCRSPRNRLTDWLVLVNGFLLWPQIA